MFKTGIIFVTIYLALSATNLKTQNEIAVFDPITCAQEKCPKQYDACIADSKCIPALNACHSKCGTGQTCWTFCLAGKGSSAAINVAKCASANGCLTMQPITFNLPALQVDVKKCVEDNCPTELSACDSACQKILTNGEARCGTYSDPKNISCWTFYLVGQRNQEAIAVAQCSQKHRCFTDAIQSAQFSLAVFDPITCAQEKCPKQYDACIADSKCIPALNACHSKCGTGQTCWTFCLAGKGSSAAINVAKCASANGCLTMQPITFNLPALQVDVKKCIEDNCPTELSACDSACQKILTNGEARCGTYSDPKNISCWTFYLVGQRNQEAIAVAQCGQKHRCFTDAIQSSQFALAVFDPITCAQEKCPKQYDACEADPKCIPALNACHSKCGTGQTCWTFCLAGKGSSAAINVAKCAAANGCI